MTHAVKEPKRDDSIVSFLKLLTTAFWYFSVNLSVKDIYRKSSFRYLLSEYPNHSTQRFKQSQREKKMLCNKKASMIHSEVTPLIFRNNLL